MKKTSNSSSNHNVESDSTEVEISPIPVYSRKEKSLGLLCENFLNLYLKDNNASVSLDSAAEALDLIEYLIKV